MASRREARLNTTLARMEWVTADSVGGAKRGGAVGDGRDASGLRGATGASGARQSSSGVRLTSDDNGRGYVGRVNFEQPLPRRYWRPSSSCSTNAGPASRSARGFRVGVVVTSRHLQGVRADELRLEGRLSVLQQHRHHFLQVFPQLVDRVPLRVGARPARDVSAVDPGLGVAFYDGVEGAHGSRSLASAGTRRESVDGSPHVSWKPALPGQVGSPRIWSARSALVVKTVAIFDSVAPAEARNAAHLLELLPGDRRPAALARGGEDQPPVAFAQLAKRVDEGAEVVGQRGFGGGHTAKGSMGRSDIVRPRWLARKRATRHPPKLRASGVDSNDGWRQ